MSFNQFNRDFDEFDDDPYTHLLPKNRSKSEHRSGRHKPNHKSKVNQRQVIENLADSSDRLEDFVPTYVANFDPKHFERQWVIKSLGGFYRDQIITDVLSIVKKGKEANVYCCKANEKTGLDYIAAKLYRPRMFRHLRNDAAYKAGRFARDEAGKTIKGSREKRAMGSKTNFGQKLDFAAWIGHEHRVHQQLFQAQADVPQPLSYRENVILMEFIGEEAQAARTLIDSTITVSEAPALFSQIMENVELMLRMNYIHGDLSAYNILYNRGAIKIIDFPQMVDARTNPNALKFLARDIDRVYTYFADFGVVADPNKITHEYWDAYQNAAL
ncbi:MAG: RIO1 family regulatory kinase/ATPase [Chloroflexota bacterium]